MKKNPQHIAIIMDGNRRWAKKHGLKLLAGHKYAGKKTILFLAKECLKLKIPYFTLWAWSTENWNRNEREVKGILNFFRQYFDEQGKNFHQLGIKIKTIGDLNRFPQDVQEGIKKWVKITSKNRKLTLIFALNYGGRNEILRAITRLTKNKRTKEQKPITEKQFSQFLDTAALPDPNLIIRPGGEKRLSGFLPWQSVYSELYFTDTLFPDFGPKELRKAITDYQKRQRRFGK